MRPGRLCAGSCQRIDELLTGFITTSDVFQGDAESKGHPVLLHEHAVDDVGVGAEPVFTVRSPFASGLCAI